MRWCHFCRCHCRWLWWKVLRKWKQRRGGGCYNNHYKSYQMPHTRTLPEKKKKCAGGDGQLYSKNGYSHLETAEKERPKLQMSAQKLTRLALSCSVFPADSGCRDLKRSGAGQSRSSSDSTFFPSFFLLINTVKEIKARSKEEKKKASDKEVGDSVCVAGKLLEHYCQENKNERKNKERKVRAC